MTKREHGTSRTPGKAQRFSIRAAMWLMALLTIAGMTSVVVASAASAATTHGAARAVAPRAPSTTNLGYTSLPSPVRIADTRTGATDPSTYAGKTLGPGQSLTVDMPSSVPSAAGAIVAQLTAINPTLGGYLAAYPAGGTIPGTANVNFVAGQIVGNMVTVGLGTDSSNGDPAVSIYNGPSGNTDFTLDLYGYYAPQTSSSGAAYVPMTPTRIVDTRANSGYAGAGQTLGAGDTLQIPITGSNGVPATASAVAVNIAVVNTTAQSYIQSFPTGSPPSSSTPTVNMNWLAGEVLSTKAIVGIGTGGDIDVYNAQGSTDVVIDLDGYFTAAGGTGSLFDTLSSPTRLKDTRPNAVAAGASLSVTVAGADGIPSNATAGVLNITDLANGPNYLTAYPAGQSVPTAADVNYTSGDTSDIVGNAAYAMTGTGGVVDIFDSTSSANIVVDAFGYFAPVTVVTTYTVSPTTAQTATVSTGYTATSSAIDYTATGLGTTAVCVALFPSSGADAPVTTSSGTTFTPSSGNAAGIGTTNNTGNAEITTVNGTATGNVDKTSTPVTPSSGSITFTLNTAATVAGTSGVDGTVPVVYAPTAGSCANLPVNSSGVPTVSYGVGGSATWTVAVLTVSPSTAQTATVSTGYTAASSAIDYTASGLGTTAMCVALFPSIGADAPVTTSSGTTFTPSSGNAAGIGTTNNTGNAEITTVNGVATGNVDRTSAPVTPSSGSITITLNTAATVAGTSGVDGTIPVVYAPTGGSCANLPVSSSGVPSVSYGVGGSATWTAQTASAGIYDDCTLIGPPNASAMTFEADCLTATTPGTYTFSYANSSDTYTYSSPNVSLSASQFDSFLSGPVASSSNDNIAAVAGDTLGTTYNPSGPSSFEFQTNTVNGGTYASDNGDVPAAATALSAVASTSPAGVELTWTASANFDVASYQVWRATVTSGGTVGTYAAISPAISATSPFSGSNCATPSATCYVDLTGVPGTTYSYVVVATATALGGNSNGSPASSAVQFTPTGISPAATAPISTSTSVGYCTACTAGQLQDGDQLGVTFNQAVSLNTSTFSLTLVNGTETATVSNTNATAALSNSNMTVTYTLTGPPSITGGSVAFAYPAEVTAQSGVSDSTGAWNLPGSGATNLSTALKEFGVATNGDLTALPADTVDQIVPNSTADTVTGACTTSDVVTVSDANGNTLGTGTCAVSAYTITTLTAVTPQSVLEVSQAPASGSGFTSATAVASGVSPCLGTTANCEVTTTAGSLGTTPTSITFYTLPGATLSITWTTTDVSTVTTTQEQGHIGTAESLTSGTPMTVVANSVGQVILTLTPGDTATQTDTFVADNDATPTNTAMTVYDD